MGARERRAGTAGAAEESGGVIERYEARVAAGEVAHDAHQAAVAARLDEVLEALPGEAPTARAGFLARLGRRRPRAQDMPKGLYVWGAVGRGKTMLMDMFFEAAPIPDKRRAHFNDFMQDVHARIADTRAAIAAGRIAGEDPIPPVAAALHGEARLLCFDEFAVDDVADAMILGRLFRELFARGLTLVATSNAAPEALYPDGLNRAHFLRFVELLKERVDVVRLDAATDYRLDRLRTEAVYFPDDPAGRAAFERLWRRMTADREVARAELSVGGRTLAVPLAAGGLARFGFDELCGSALGAADYAALARRFHTLFLEGVPAMTQAMRNEAMRFITLVDVLYEARTRLVLTAAGEPEELYAGQTGKEAFAFARTASRLHEMRSESWIRMGEETPLT